MKIYANIIRSRLLMIIDKEIKVKNLNRLESHKNPPFFHCPIVKGGTVNTEISGIAVKNKPKSAVPKPYSKKWPRRKNCKAQPIVRTEKQIYVVGCKNNNFNSFLHNAHIPKKCPGHRSTSEDALYLLI